MLSVLSCDKKVVDQDFTSEQSSDRLIQEAQNYFQSCLAISPKSRIAASATNQSIPKEWLDKRLPQWDQAISFTKDGKEIVEVPLLYNGIDPVYTFTSSALGNKGVISQKNGVTKALFFKHKDGTTGVYIMKLILDPDYLAKTKQDNQHKKLSFKAIPKDFSGVLLMMGWNEQLADLYRFQNGKIMARIHPATPASKNARRDQCYYNPRCDLVCIGVGASCCTEQEQGVNPGGNCCSTNWNYCSYQCVYDEICYPDDDPTEPGGSGSGDSGDNNTATNADITVDPNLNDCFKGVINAVTTDQMKNFMNREFKKLYGDNAGTKNFSFIAGNTGDDALGLYQRSDNRIVLDASKVAQASNEFVASVICHELAHLLITEYQTTGIVPPDQYEQHMTIFNSWVDNIKTMLIQAYPSLNNEDAVALALGGIADVVLDKNNQIKPQMDQLAQTNYNTTLASASTIIEAYKSGTKGTKCNQ